MKETECLGLPYPECAPPLVKDASDIVQFKALADATDAAVQTLADSVDNLYTSPDAVAMVGGINAAGQDVTHFLGGTEFDNAGMADLTAQVIRILETGWYLLGGHVQISTLPAVFVRAEPLVNGDPVSSRQGPGFATAGVEAVSFTDALFLQAGDALQMMTHHVASPVTVNTYSVRMWALRILVNV
jgi:hypothetical protein